MKLNPKHMWLLVTDERWDAIALLNSEENPHLVGETLADIGRMRNTSPFDAALDLLQEEGERMGGLLWTSHSFSDDDIELCLTPAWLCSDIRHAGASTLRRAGEVPSGSVSGYGWAARFLGLYVRERNVLPLAGRHPPHHGRCPRSAWGLPMTGGGCERGLAADVTVFDRSAIESRCTIREPRAYAGGIVHVLVNGRFAMRDGAFVQMPTTAPCCARRLQGASGILADENLNFPINQQVGF